MNRSWFAPLLTLLLAAYAPAQGPKPDEGVPAPSNIRGSEYPRIHDDLSITFRIKAPDAQKVEFGFFSPERFPATRGRGRLLDRNHGAASRRGSTTTGCFSTACRSTTPAARPSTAPASRPAGSRSPRRASTMTCPGTCPTARSASAGISRRRRRAGGASSSTPRPATTPTATRGIPVLYLQHGGGEDETGMAQSGPRRLHPRQPDRRAEGEADDRRDGAGLRRTPRRGGPSPAPPRLAAPGRGPRRGPISAGCSARSRT